MPDNNILAYIRIDIKFELILVDNGSTDLFKQNKILSILILSLLAQIRLTITNNINNIFNFIFITFGLNY